MRGEFIIYQKYKVKKFEKKYYKYIRKIKKEKIIISNLLLIILSFSLELNPIILKKYKLSSLKKYYKNKLFINILLIINKV